MQASSFNSRTGEAEGVSAECRNGKMGVEGGGGDTMDSVGCTFVERRSHTGVLHREVSLATRLAGSRAFSLKWLDALDTGVWLRDMSLNTLREILRC